MLKRAVRGLINRFGYDITRKRPELGNDPFADMRRLCGKDAPVVFDVGANTGQTVHRFRRFFPRPEIHAFEPGPATFRELSANVGELPGVTLNHAAVGAEAGTKILIENTNSDMSSLLEPSAGCWGEVRNRQEVEGVTIDGYASARGIDRIDVLKTDTQGYDLQVLRGAEGLFARQAVGLVYLEVIFSDMYEGIPRFDEIYGHLADRGMALVAMYNFYFRNDRAAWVDALFVNRSG
jgi:FkbM family methyltransferase